MHLLLVVELVAERAFVRVVVVVTVILAGLVVCKGLEEEAAAGLVATYLVKSGTRTNQTLVCIRQRVLTLVTAAQVLPPLLLPPATRLTS